MNQPENGEHAAGVALWCDGHAERVAQPRVKAAGDLRHDGMHVYSKQVSVEQVAQPRVKAARHLRHNGMHVVYNMYMHNTYNNMYMYMLYMLHVHVVVHVTCISARIWAVTPHQVFASNGRLVWLRRWAPWPRRSKIPTSMCGLRAAAGLAALVYGLFEVCSARASTSTHGPLRHIAATSIYRLRVPLVSS